MNVGKHDLVPNHVKLSDEEKRKVLQEFNVSISQLPVIFEGDPAIEKVGAVPGDLIKITRKSQTTIDATYYRVVIHG